MKSFRTKQKPPKKDLVKCSNGPWEGKYLLLDRYERRTMVFTLHGETGYYERGYFYRI